MSFILSSNRFILLLRKAQVPLLMLFMLFLSGMTHSAGAVPPVNSEITRIMQERKSVEQNLMSLKRQLKEFQGKLNSANRKESQSLKALTNIRNQILLLEKMISENQKYLVKLDGDIERLNGALNTNRRIYGKVSTDFRRTAVSVYKYGGNRDVEHLFAAGSFNDALVRAQYMGFFTRAVSSNVDKLQQAAAELEKNRLALEQSYRQKAEAVREQEQELKTFAASKKEKEVVLERLKKNKQEYMAQLSIVQQKRRQLQSRIESLILAQQQAVEVEKERQRKIMEARRLEAQRLEEAKLLAKKESASGQSPETAKKEKKKQQKTEVRPPEKQSVRVPEANAPELERVSADFDNSYGSLPWPVRNGVVSQRFGSVEDKDLKIVTTNNGIDITVPSGTQVRAVSGGKVAQIAFLPTLGNIVIVRHPNSYLTVYANLGRLSVVKDELIKSQQLVGLSGKMSDGGSVVHFEIWKGRVKQNPEKWLRK